MVYNQLDPSDPRIRPTGGLERRESSSSRDGPEASPFALAISPKMDHIDVQVRAGPRSGWHTRAEMGTPRWKSCLSIALDILSGCLGFREAQAAMHG